MRNLFPPQAPIRVLDLGAGTGLLSAFILVRYPHARLVLYDASARMLAIVRERFHSLGEQVGYLLGERGKYDGDLSAG